MSADSSNQPSPKVEAQLAELIDRQWLRTVFQPIVEMRSGEVIGHEVLTRPTEESGFANADGLFSAGETHGMNWKLEGLARRLAMAAAGSWRPGTLLFMNSSPEVLADRRFAHQVLQELRTVGKLTPTRIVLEITERCREREFEELPASVEALRETGFQLAIDDVGAGTSGLNRIMTLRPGWLKLDRELVAGIHEDKIRQHMVRFLVYFGRLSSTRVIGEGIECMEELDALIDLGVGYGQGYLLGRPGEPVHRIEPSLARHIRARASRLAVNVPVSSDRGYARALARQAPICESTMLVRTVATMMLHDLEHPGCVVVDGGYFAGWCDRDVILRAASDGRASLPISYLVGSNRAAVDAATPLADVLELASARSEHTMGSPLVVLDDDHVLGIIPLSSLLKAAAGPCRSSQSTHGWQAGVPGRVRTDMHLRDMMDNAVPDRHYDVAFIDVRGFAEYNHRFGYDLGDQLIQHLVAQMRSVLLHEVDDAFIGHLGDDQFVVSAPRGMLDENLGPFISGFESHSCPVESGESGQARITSVGARIMILEHAVPTCRHVQDLYRSRSQLRTMLDRSGQGSQGSGASQVVRGDARQFSELGRASA